MVDGPPERGDNASAQQLRRLVQRPLVAGPLLLGLLVVLLLACVLWIPGWLYPPLTETDLGDVSDAAKVQELKGARLKLQNDARTTLLQGLGALLVLTGAGIGAAMTLRQVKVSQDGLKDTRGQMQRTWKSTQRQLKLTQRQLRLARQGQVTDRYTRAIEQLGHEKAPVRLGALYSLEHLAQDNPEYRQDVVDVFCAYLRMPYTPPAGRQPHAEQAEKVVASVDDRNQAPQRTPAQDPAQEDLQVRLTLQRILARHLRPFKKGINKRQAQLLHLDPEPTFWPEIDLNLTGATLVNLDFTSVSIASPQFHGATFQGAADFSNATFYGTAWFDGVTFHHDANFAVADFYGIADFTGVAFKGEAWFSGTFHEWAYFTKANFHQTAKFSSTRPAESTADFESTAFFDGATFHGNADSTRMRFGGLAKFLTTRFQGQATFDHVAFKGEAWFEGAGFGAKADFSSATFRSATTFDGARFDGVTRFDRATFPYKPASSGYESSTTHSLDRDRPRATRSATIQLTPPTTRWNLRTWRASPSRRSLRRIRRLDNGLSLAFAAGRPSGR